MYQFAVKAASITIELVVKTTAPQRSVSGTTVGALSLDTSRSGVGSGLVAGETCARNVGGSSVLCLDAQGGPFVRLGVGGGEGWKLVHCRSEGSKGSHVGEGRGRGRSTCLLRLVKGGNGLHVNILRLEVLVETGGRRPGTRRLDRCEKFIEWQLNRWTDDVEMIDVVECQTFSKADGIGTGGSGVVEGTRIEVVGEECRKTEGGGGLVVLADNWLSGVRCLAAALGQGGFFVVVVIHNIVGDGGGSAARRLVKLSGGLEVWLLDRTRHGGRSGLVDAERELHALNSAWSAVEASLAVPFLLSSAQLDHIGGMVPFVPRSFKFSNAPVSCELASCKKNEGGYHMPSFFLVEFVAHMLGELLKLPLGASIVGINHKVLEVP
jgi:hypothetical protein